MRVMYTIWIFIAFPIKINVEEHTISLHQETTNINCLWGGGLDVKVPCPLPAQIKISR